MGANNVILMESLYVPNLMTAIIFLMTGLLFATKTWRNAFSVTHRMLIPVLIVKVLSILLLLETVVTISIVLTVKLNHLLAITLEIISQIPLETYVLQKIASIVAMIQQEIVQHAPTIMALIKKVTKQKIQAVVIPSILDVLAVVLMESAQLAFLDIYLITTQNHTVVIKN